MSKELTPQGARLSIHPGEWYFGNEYESLYTVLGSCVALSVWHPTLKLGGLCHYLLPAKPGYQVDADKGSEGRYGKTALAILKKAMLGYAPLKEFELGLFGGSDTLISSETFTNSANFTNVASRTHYSIGKQNILFAQRWLQDENLIPTQIEVGGTGSRSLIMELVTGEVTVKHYEI